MKKNLGTLDRIIRFALAAVFIYLYARSYWFYAESIPGGDFVELSLFVVGVLLIISSVVGFCPVLCAVWVVQHQERRQNGMLIPHA